jgi:hypothetical protein
MIMPTIVPMKGRMLGGMCKKRSITLGAGQVIESVYSLPKKVEMRQSLELAFDKG